MSATPFRSYMICTAPRSGSTLLCKLLAGTGICGNPDSHFHEPSLDNWLADYDLNPQDYGTRREALQAVFQAAMTYGKGATGLFGLRMQGRSFGYFMRQLELLVPGRMRDVQRIESSFGQTLFLHLSRPDRLDQAISLLRAEQTGLWHRRSDGTELERLAPPAEAHYDAEAIKRYMGELAALDQAWEKWFHQERLEPLRISYDALSTDPQAVLAQVLSALHLDPVAVRAVGTPTAKLADATSRAWRDRFERER